MKFNPNAATKIVIFAADDPSLEGLLLAVTKANIRYVQFPGGRIARFNKQGYEMGDQHSRYTIAAWV